MEVAHETVLKGWQRLEQWTRDHAETLRARRDLKQVASEWDKSGRQSSALRTGKLLQRYLGSAEPRSPIADDYLKACKSRRTGFRIAYSVLGLIFLSIVGILFHVNKSHYPPTLATKAMFIQLGLWPVTLPNMVYIRADEFEMGDLSGSGQSDERPVHTVQFIKDYEIGKYEVTFTEYDLFAAATGRNKPSDEGWGRGARPVINISWVDALAYTQWLSQRTGFNYRLPSESEWEYAARATTKTVRYWAENNQGEKESACKYANVFDAKNESRIKNTYNITWEAFNCADDYPFTAPVGRFTANNWGLHDIMGNVWEWNQDCYIGNYKNAPEDGVSRESSDGSDCSRRVLRGGSWNYGAQNMRSADRGRNTPDYRNYNIGFRLARTL